MTSVILSGAHLKTFGLDSEAFRAELSEWPEADRVQVVDAWSEWRPAPDAGDETYVLVGRREPVAAAAVPASRQTPLDVSGLVPWMGPDHTDALKRLIRSALREIGKDTVPAQVAIEAVKRVLVYGGGAAGDMMALELQKAGIDTVRAVEADGEAGGSGTDLFSGHRLKTLGGFAGRFEAGLSGKDGGITLSAGAVVLAGPEKRKPEDPGEGFSVRTLSEFEQEGLSGLEPRPEGGLHHIVFLAGMTGPTSTSSMRRILEAAGKTAAHVNTWVMAPQVKVAGSGLETLYGRVRDAGAVFIRIPEGGPTVETGPGGRSLFRVFDPVAKADLLLRPDVVIVEEHLVPAGISGEWGLGVGPDGFQGPDNALFMPSLTARKGIYAIGPARGTDSAEALAAEIRGAVDDILHLFGLQRPEVRVIVDDLKCAHCLSCLRACPHGAILFNSRPWINPLACMACGTCTARCPAKAISQTGVSDDRTRARLASLLPKQATAEDRHFEPRLVVFGCRRSAKTALSVSRPGFPVDVSLVELPCGGRLDDALILESFIKGADGVIVAVCHDGNCRSSEGSDNARKRVERIREIMAGTGLSPDRLEFMTLAPNMGTEFRKMLKQFRDNIKEMGASFGNAGTGRP